MSLAIISLFLELELSLKLALALFPNCFSSIIFALSNFIFDLVFEVIVCGLFCTVKVMSGKFRTILKFNKHSFFVQTC